MFKLGEAKEIWFLSINDRVLRCPRMIAPCSREPDAPSYFKGTTAAEFPRWMETLDLSWLQRNTQPRNRGCECLVLYYTLLWDNRAEPCYRQQVHH